MTADSRDILVEALRDTDRLGESFDQWEALIRRGREADLLGTLAFRLNERGRLDAVPAAPRAHLLAAQYRCRAQQVAVLREVDAIAAALNDLRVQVVLLKGAAYLLAGLPPSRGRLFSDIDILV
ncbi:MAG TPA: nucleotidyltransferase family protein, partial [Casimicrobiaceae bacterium]